MSARIIDTPLAGGEASKVILRSYGSKKTIIKSSIYGDIKAEAVVLRILRSRGVSVPRPLRVRNGILYMEYVPGRNAQEVKITSSVIKNIAKVVKKMHSVHNDVVGRLDAPSGNTPENWIRLLEGKVGRGIKNLSKHGFLNRKEATALGNRFGALAKRGCRTFRPTIVHSDLHLDNIRITPSGKIFILDFENPFWGDGLYDMAPFKYFHPSLYPAFRKAYSPVSFAREKKAIRLYLFVHAIDIGSFYANIGNKEQVARALRTARSGRVA
jgi:Ser/Thr protein kinase RdoA (MazF antagonist)